MCKKYCGLMTVSILTKPLVILMILPALRALVKWFVYTLMILSIRFMKQRKKPINSSQI